MLVEVLVRTAAHVFVSVQTVNITQCATSSGEPSAFEPEGDERIALRLPYTVEFSPCGRFAAILDQRPTFRLSISNHSIVILDLARRLDRRGVRALTLAPADDVVPRSVCWTESALWLQARHGALVLCAK